VHDEFLALGGFSLLSPLLYTMREERAHLLLPVLATLLEASALRIGTDTVLLYPHLVSVCLRSGLAIKNPPKKTHLKKPTKNVFFWVFFGFFKKFV
jgi:hypothetical protein